MNVLFLRHAKGKGDVFMPGYIAIIICIFILAATGGLKAMCGAVGISLFGVCYTLIGALAMSVFYIRIGVEISINLGAAVLICLPGALMKKQNSEAYGVGAVMLTAIMIALLKHRGMMYGADSGLLCGLMAGTSALAMWDNPVCAVCSAGCIPVVVSVIGSFLSLAFSGYAAVEIGHDTMAAQLIALSISFVIIWIRSLQPQSAPAEKS